MQQNVKISSNSEDEDDLELLRQAALKSLKRPAANEVTSILNIPNTNNNLFTSKGVHKRKRGFAGAGRLHRNGLHVNRVRNSNLISVPTVETESSFDVCSKVAKAAPIPKLILPQDRYCNKRSEPTESNAGTSKFDRYNDSEKSESESESDNDNVNDLPKKLECSDSLEVLMKELENEIQGETEEDTKNQMNKIKKPKKLKETFEEKTDQKYADRKQEEEMECKASKEMTKKEVVAKGVTQRGARPIMESKKEPQKSCVNRKNNFKSYKKFCQRSPTFPNPLVHQQPLGVTYVNSNAVTLPTILPPFQPSVHYSNLPVLPQGVYGYTPYANPVLPSESNSPIYPPAYSAHPYEHHLPLLNINTEMLNTVSAPLSPRSAAFVLQNRKIIERRKKSPMRSYSRSPSSEFRFSPSPPRYKRSRSPTPPINLKKGTRTSPAYKKRSTSPKCSRYPLDYRSRQSEKSKNSPARKSSPKSSVRNRLIEENKDKRSSSPNRENVAADSVLEARKRKFESNGVVHTEGKIRLRPKMEDKQDEGKDGDNSLNDKEEEDFNEDDDDLFGDIDDYVDFNVDDLFSDDEESDNENEGRFKSKTDENSQTTRTILPFSRLIKDTATNVKNEPLDKETSNNRKEKETRGRERNKSKNRERKRSNSPTNKSHSSQNEKKTSSAKNAANKVSLTTPIENKRIEIKIRNPTKYEVEEKTKNKNLKEDVTDKPIVRNVRLKSSTISQEPDSDEDIQLEVEDLPKSEGAGDLRAQLSRKRAERQNLLPKAEGVQQRLIRDALQGAVFTKSKKSKVKEKEAAPDGKLPIHLRLGIPSNSDTFSDPKVQKKKNSKNRGSIEQV